MKHRLLEALLFLLFFPLFATAEGVADLVGKTFVLFHTQSGKVLSNRQNFQNNAPIYVESYKFGDFGQVWKLNAKNIEEQVFTIENQAVGKSVDLVLQNVALHPVQWTTDNNNDNQWVQFTEKTLNGKKGYVLSSASNKYTRKFLKIDAYSRLVLTDRESDAAHWTLTAANQPSIPSVAWQDEKVFAVNVEPGHAWQIPYGSTEEMRADKQRYEHPWQTPNSSRILSLNGLWKLQWTKDVAQLDSAFSADQYDTSAMDTITVPSCLEMKGYGVPHYINVDYAFADAPPYIQMKSGLWNSVANYRRNFTLSSAWCNERTLLHFDGLSAGAYVWVNGRSVGYTEPGNNDVEFDITPYVREGENNVSVQVIRWTDASYIEGQDMWHFSGIHRDVYLVSVPRTFVRDHYITAELNRATGYRSGELKVEFDIDNRDAKAADGVYGIRVLSPEGEELQKAELSKSFAEGEKEGKLNFSFPMTDLRLWSAESPVLYTIEVFQRPSADAPETLAFSTKYGFRNIEQRGNVYYINGQRVFFRGVNTQDIHPVHGRSIDVSTMLKDIVMMKQANVNTVRTSHYPRQAKMNAMFDYYGLYVMDEADVECHKNWEDHRNGGGISDKESWGAPIVYRNRTMVLRDRNFPSVIFWSLGNESHAGRNFTEAYHAVRGLDPRPIHYEGASRHNVAASSDMHSDMYPTLEEVKERCRYNNYGPYFICEYAHAMGNAIGNLQEYWDIIEGKPNASGTWTSESSRGIGGCIWDWVDQGIYDAQDIKNKNLVDPSTGFHRFRSGYDYPGPHQGNFMSNGIITASRSWSAKLNEVKQVYQSVKFTRYDAEKRQLKLMNRYNFTTLDAFALNWRVLIDGRVAERGTIALPATPTRQYATLTIPFTTPLAGDKEITLQADVVLTAPTAWAEAGHAVAAFETILHERAELAPVTVAAGTVKVETDGNDFSVITPRQVLMFNKMQGMQFWQLDGTAVCKGMGVPTYDNFRWIENDVNLRPEIGSLFHNVTYSLADDGKSAQVIDIIYGSVIQTKLIYTIYADETVDLKAEFSPTAKNLLRLGIGMYFAQPLTNLHYYARGPWENYADRKTGSRLGRYETTVAEMFTPYAHPQTCGGREDLRELTLFDANGNGWKVETQGQVSFSALHYADRQFKKTVLHPYDLTPSAGVHVHFDYYQRGVGNGSCGNVRTIEQYRCPSEGEYSYILRFSPVKDVATSAPRLPQSSAPSSSVVFDLTGRRVDTPRHSGIYVIDGRKTWVK